MVNRKRLMVFILILFIVLIGSAIIVIIHNKSPDINTFSVSEYQYYIDNFPSEENMGKISDSNDLLNKVEAFWINKYGERIKSEKPFQVFYDEKNEIWFVRGTLRSGLLGGVANILVENSTGRVLAVWRDK